MSILITTLGVIFCIALIILFLCFSYSYITDSRDVKNLRIYQQGLEAGVARERRILLDRSWWFSKDPRTMYMLQRILESSDIYQVRKQWEDSNETVKTTV